MGVMEAQTMTTYWLKTRPYSLIDAINRMALATGSVRNAQIASHADYNGHLVQVHYNDYRKYWVAEYFWGERVVLGRGEYTHCLEMAKREYDRGALGACVAVQGPLTPEQEAQAVALGYEPWSETIQAEWLATWRDDRYDEVPHLSMWERQLGIPASALLIESKTKAEYEEKRRNYRHPGMAPRKTA